MRTRVTHTCLTSVILSSTTGIRLQERKAHDNSLFRFTVFFMCEIKHDYVTSVCIRACMLMFILLLGLSLCRADMKGIAVVSNVHAASIFSFTPKFALTISIPTICVLSSRMCVILVLSPPC
jgi:hypothetical protein